MLGGGWLEDGYTGNHQKELYVAGALLGPSQFTDMKRRARCEPTVLFHWMLGVGGGESCLVIEVNVERLPRPDCAVL